MNTKALSIFAFAIGSTVILWMSSTFITNNALALFITLVIAITYVIGAREMLYYQLATKSLIQALAHPIVDKSESKSWSQRLEQSLRVPVLQRIEGEHTPLPLPILTPYLLGLLVMLGLLGTFAGMVTTLQGAVSALQGSAELAAIKTSLAMPIKGLGLAFGTSVAGVAASAMLGLIASLSKRDRLLASQQLDKVIAEQWFHFSYKHQQQQTFQALQKQADQLPSIAAQLGTIGSQLTDSQQIMHERTEALFQNLASSVANNLNHSLSQSGQLIGESLQPIVTQVMSSIADSAQQLQQTSIDQAQAQLDKMSKSYHDQQQQTEAKWQQNFQLQLDALNQSQTSWLNQQQQTGKQQLEQIGSLISINEKLAQTRIEQEAQWRQQADQQLQKLTESICAQLSTLNQQQNHHTSTTIDQLQALQQVCSNQLADLGQSLEQPLRALISDAAAAPKAAAEVLTQLQQAINTNQARENELLQERTQILNQISQLTESLHKDSQIHQQQLQTLIAETETGLQQANDSFQQQITAETGKLTEMVELFATSSHDMACAGESFEVAVNHFSDGNARLMEHLNKIETALQSATDRSDEQLGYYVAQARELIDHSMLSQQEMIEKIRHLKPAEEAVN